VAGLAGGRPEPLVLVAPLLAVLGSALTRTAAPSFSAVVVASPDRVTFGDDCMVDVALSAPPGCTVELRVDLPPAVVSREGSRHRVHLDDGTAGVELPIDVRRWGAFDVGSLSARVVAPGGFLAMPIQVHARASLRVYPTPQLLRELVGARDTSLVVGSHVARGKGAGLEFAEVRLHRPGDRVREVNWRATARRGSIWVNERHPERSVDVVVLVDSFTGAELPRAVAAANAVVRAHLVERDRVGLVSFGGATRWVRPGMGMRQLYLVVDALLESRVVATEIWRDLTVVPARVLPPTSIVIAISPLQDERTVAAIHDLAGRGRDLAVLALGAAATPVETSRESALADRLRRLHWTAMLDDLHARGVPAVTWGEGERLGEAVEALSRQHRRVARLA
jgi:uncharacterized protein (DUF58 family)